jgi:cell division protein FtsW
MNIFKKILIVEGDKIIWRIIFLLLLISVLTIFSSSSKLAEANGFRHSAYWYFINKHLLFLGVGIVAMFLCYQAPISFYKNIANIAIVGSIGLLLYMLFFGQTINDGTRWISIFGFTIQPIEFAKVSVVIYLAKVLEDNNFDNFRDVIRKIVIPIGIVCVLTFIAGTSMGLLMGIICLCVLFIGGLPMKQLFRVVGLACAALLVLVFMGLTIKYPPRVVTALNRIKAFTNDDKKTSSEEKTYKLTQADYSKMAVASGGITGKGPANSIQRHLLSQSYSDFVFAIVIEEYGLVAGIIILLAYMGLLYRAATIAKKCTRIFSSVTVLGLMLMIVFQALLNMGVAVGIFPVTGQTLPFISNGGTSILLTSIAFGIILSISRTANRQENQNLQNNIEENIDNENEITENKIQTAGLSDAKEKIIEYELE